MWGYNLVDPFSFTAGWRSIAHLREKWQEYKQWFAAERGLELVITWIYSITGYLVGHFTEKNVLFQMYEISAYSNGKLFWIHLITSGVLFQTYRDAAKLPKKKCYYYWHFSVFSFKLIYPFISIAVLHLDLLICKILHCLLCINPVLCVWCLRSYSLCTRIIHGPIRMNWS
jgi:hypothetical protein